MADNLPARVGTFETSLKGVTNLLGSAPAGTQKASGLAGAAALLDDSPADRVDAVASSLGDTLPAILRFDAASAVGQVATLFPDLEQAAKRPPAGATGAFDERLEAAGTALATDLLDNITDALDALRSISTAIPSDPAVVVGALVDQLLRVTASLDGPEAEQIRAWAKTLQELQRELTPLIEQAAAAPDAGAFAVAIIERSLESTLETLGFPRARKLVRLLAHFPSQAVEQALIEAAVDAFGELVDAFEAVKAAKAKPFAELRDAVAEAAEAIQAAKRALRPLLGAVRRVRQAKILQPGALEAEIRALLDHAASVRVDDVAKVDDPFKTLLDRIDEAVEAIDLSPVRDEVLGFFKDLRTAIESVELPDLQAALAPAHEAVDGLRDGIGEVQARLQAFVDELASGVHDAASAVGAFQPDGSFQFGFEAELRDLLEAAHLAVAGDPDDPAAPSLAGTLDSLRKSLDGLFKELGTVLGDVVTAISKAVGDAKAGLSSFAEYVEDLELGTKSEELRGEVQKIVDELDAINFDALVDEVVGVLDDNTEKLRAIEPADMNELLRTALKAVLQVFLDFNFAGAITQPLEDGLADVAKLPADAVADLQGRWEQVLERLDALRPERLLDPLFAALATIEDAIGHTSLSTLLEPLDDLHREYLQKPFDSLAPADLLEPATRTFHEYTGALDRLRGADLVGPLAQQLGQLQKQVAGVRLDQPLADLLTAVDDAKRDLKATKPSVLLKPLTDEVTALLSKLDALKPSQLIGPAAALAGPLLEQLETIQQEAIDALYALFQAPLAVLEQLEPQKLQAAVGDGLDAVAEAVRTAQVRSRFDALKATHFDLAKAVAADPRRAALVALLDPEPQLGPLVAAHDELLTGLAELGDAVEQFDLAAAYAELRDRLLALLPPYARRVLEPQAFKVLIQMADPTGFAHALDERFATVRAKLVPIAPETLSAELDATWATAVALIDEIDLTQPVADARAAVKALQDVITGLRVDFLAVDVDRALTDLRAVVAALDPARVSELLTPLHTDLAAVLATTLPSKALAGLAAELEAVTAKLSLLDLGASIKQPLDRIWKEVDGGLHALDLRIILAPITDRLEELALELAAGLDKTEDHFVAMVAAGKAAI